MTDSGCEPILGVRHTAPGFAMPAGATDCHVHVFGPADRFAFAPARTYTPGDASLADLKRLHTFLGIERVVVVHPSPYGADNACSIDAARWIGPSARVVAVIEGGESDATLEAMHQSGVRGVRLNLHSTGVFEPEAAWAGFEAAARRVASLGWHVQTFTSLDMIAALAGRLASLPVTLVIDHFGHAQASRGPDQEGFAALLGLVAGGKTYVKLSAGYRISSEPGWSDIPPIAKALIAANPGRVVWGSDWPHPGGGARTAASIDTIEPFQPIDDGAALDRLRDWCAGDAGLLRRILVDNPARLYDFA